MKLDGGELERLEPHREFNHLGDERLGQEVHHPEAAVPDGLLLLQNNVRLVVRKECGVQKLQDNNNIITNLPIKILFENETQKQNQLKLLIFAQQIGLRPDFILPRYITWRRK